jgi:hypothetical protein
MKNESYFYLFLSLVGGGLTFYFAMKGVIAHQGHFDVLAFIQSTWIQDDYAKSLTLDFWTGSIAGTFFILSEGKRLKIKYQYLYVFLTFVIGYAFAFPLFLFVRSRYLNQL